MEITLMRLIGCLPLFTSLILASSSITLSPRAAVVGQANLTYSLILSRSEFSPQSQVLLNGTVRRTTFDPATPTILTFSLLPTDVSAVQKFTVSVKDRTGTIVSKTLSVFWPCGQDIGSHMNGVGSTVIAYSNGVDTGTGENCGQDVTILGGQYQCVELIRRYYVDLMTQQNSPHDPSTTQPTSAWHGDAITFFDTNHNTKRGLVEYTNGNMIGQPPQADDIIVFKQIDAKTKQLVEGGYGHVAIVGKTNGSQISVLEQNFASGGTARLTYDQQTNTIADRPGWRVLGWVRPANRKPTGSFDGIDPATGKIFGWGQDLDNPGAPIQVRIYIDKNAGTPDASPITLTASDSRLDIGDHAFDYLIPQSYRDGQAHTAWVWAIDLSDATGAHNVPLPGSPRTFSLLPSNKPPTAGFSLTSANQSIGSSSTLTVIVPTGGSAGIFLDGSTPNHSFDPDGSIQSWSWTINGALASVAPTFNQIFSKGIYTVSLVVHDNVGAASPPATATLTVREVPGASSYSVLDLSTSGMSLGFAINNLGQVLGKSSTGVPVLWTPGAGATILSAPTGCTWSGTGLNNVGNIVGYAECPPFSNFQGLLYGASGFSFLETSAVPALASVFPIGINDSNQIGGYYTNAYAWTPSTCAFRLYPGVQIRDETSCLGSLSNTWQGGLSDARGGINSSGHLAGASLVNISYGTGNVLHAVIFTPTGLWDLGVLPSDSNNFYDSSYGTALNANDHVVGNSYSGGNIPIGPHHGFYYDGTSMVDLGIPAGAREVVPTGINIADQVVGTAGWETCCWRLASSIAFVWTPTTGMRDLNALIPTGSGWTLTDAQAINDAGVILATGTYAGVNRIVLLIPQ
jgi:hypothetical protein